MGDLYRVPDKNHEDILFYFQLLDTDGLKLNSSWASDGIYVQSPIVSEGRIKPDEG